LVLSITSPPEKSIPLSRELLPSLSSSESSEPFFVPDALTSKVSTPSISVFLMMALFSLLISPIAKLPKKLIEKSVEPLESFTPMPAAPIPILFKLTPLTVTESISSISERLESPDITASTAFPEYTSSP
jgi:hypothetical protein